MTYYQAGAFISPGDGSYEETISQISFQNQSMVIELVEIQGESGAIRKRLTMLPKKQKRLGIIGNRVWQPYAPGI